MREARQQFSEAECAEVAAAIAEAEQTTEAEIIAVVATASGRYDRAEDLFGVLLSVLVLLFGAWWMVSLHSGDAWSGGGNVLPIVAWLMPVAAFLSFILGAMLASRFPVLRLPFIANNEMDEEVERRAAEAFQRFRLRGTQGATGILVFVSLFEHRVRVIGDDTIAQKLGDEDWQGVCDRIVDQAKQGEIALGLVEGIRHCGGLASRFFPKNLSGQASSNANQLNDELRFLDAP